MDILPEYDPDDGQEEIGYFNSWRGEIPQEVTRGDDFTPFVNLNPDRNLIAFYATEFEFTRLLSALYFGAEFAYPDSYLEIIMLLLSAIHAPPVMEDQECYDYPNYASFITYPLQNPYIQPDYTPPNYLLPPMIVNGENGNDVPGYEHFDVLVVLDSITLDLDWFETLDGQLPTIQFMVKGAGKVLIKMLATPAGGVAVITVDNPPDLADIILGIVTGADNIIDLNQDLVALPPETVTELIYETNTVGAGIHTIYIVFLPIIDDSLIPIRFGGGFRGVTLCDFIEEVDVGVTDVKWDDLEFMLMQQKNGEYLPVTDFQLFLDYIDSIDTVANNALNAANTALAENVNQDLFDLQVIDWIDALNTSQEAQDIDIADNAAAAAAAQSTADAATATNIAQQAELDDHEARITALENAQVSEQVWSHEFDFTAGDQGWSGGADYVAGQGFLFDANENINTSSISVRDSRIAWIELTLKRATGTNISATVEYTPTFNSQNCYVNATASGISVNWAQINPIAGSHSPQIKMIPAGSNSFYLQKAVFWGRGTDPF